MPTTTITFTPTPEQAALIDALAKEARGEIVDSFAKLVRHGKAGPAEVEAGMRHLRQFRRKLDLYGLLSAEMEVVAPCLEKLPEREPKLIPAFEESSQNTTGEVKFKMHISRRLRELGFQDPRGPATAECGVDYFRLAMDTDLDHIFRSTEIEPEDLALTARQIQAWIGQRQSVLDFEGNSNFSLLWKTPIGKLAVVELSGTKEEFPPADPLLTLSAELVDFHSPEIIPANDPKMWFIFKKAQPKK
ncbi:MAG: hypothetical protein PHV93_00420 [Candidatus Pacebacteria bacterium]|nr:hypothetical protein [Candidatus Paceibacterota bacterium]